jgi:hypothetical protein
VSLVSISVVNLEDIAARQRREIFVTEKFHTAGFLSALFSPDFVASPGVNIIYPLFGVPSS